MGNAGWSDYCLLESVCSVRIFAEQTFPAYINLLILCLGIFLAWVTYQFVEKPIRFGTHFEKKALILLMISLILCFIGLLTYFEKIPSRIKNQGVLDIVQAANEWEFPKDLDRVKIKGIEVRALEGASHIMFAGDSNAEQYSPKVVSFLKNSSEDRGTFFLTKGDCLLIRGTESSIRNKETVASCRQLQDDILTIAKDESIDTIVLSAIWFNYFSKKTGWKINDLPLSTDEGRAQAMLSLENMIKEMKRPGRRIFIVSNIPTGAALDPKSLVHRNIFRDELTINKTFIEKDLFVEENRAIYDSLRKLAMDNEVIFIDPLDFLCTDNKCPAISRDGVAIYKDNGHLRPKFMRNITYLDSALASPVR